MKRAKKFRMPKDPIERATIWQGQLGRVVKAQHEIDLESINIGKKVIDLEFQEIQLGKSLRSERSALHKLELENRMKALCLVHQKQKLEEALAMCK